MGNGNNAMIKDSAPAPWVVVDRHDDVPGLAPPEEDQDDLPPRPPNPVPPMSSDSELPETSDEELPYEDTEDESDSDEEVFFAFPSSLVHNIT